jgi:hypothetical protein
MQIVSISGTSYSCHFYRLSSSYALNYNIIVSILRLNSPAGIRLAGSTGKMILHTSRFSSPRAANLFMPVIAAVRMCFTIRADDLAHSYDCGIPNARCI